MNVALFQPEIPQNTAAILRTLACFGAEAHIVGPAAFNLSERAQRRAGLDYAQTVPLTHHTTFEAFQSAMPGRIVLLTTGAETLLHDFAFDQSDTLLFGRESAGVPETVHAAASARVRIPLMPQARSLNLAVAVGIALMAAYLSSGAITTKGLR
ncbi:rRNA methyltransferase [Acuticoccus sediminis]|uniref:tRNA (cytidine(34)-2'-O)-methyltransferase n=1 Tax=Acuticoccus sediminis TaxID=2184697 RepID=A0A8B2P2B3_9HYPH|nr:tRNA (cytidine(34)-2'-O)-methyltransferase [Acuticoccus sediminis]RAI04084.1 rRNA methyltransferase [Acuticoccus sediminis]